MITFIAMLYLIAVHELAVTSWLIGAALLIDLVAWSQLGEIFSSDASYPPESWE